MTVTNPKRIALVVASGKGNRFGGQKQFHTVSGKPAVVWSLETFTNHPEVDAVYLVVSDMASAKSRLANWIPETSLHWVTGGDTRMASVQAGLSAIQADGFASDTWVMVHDAARPAFSSRALSTLLQHMTNDTSSAYVLAKPVTDTLKSVDAKHRVTATIDRNRHCRAQTPQCAPLGVLQEALQVAEQEHRLVTDESTALEAMRYPVTLVLDSDYNEKLTFPEDVPMLETALSVSDEPTVRIGQGFDLHRLEAGDGLKVGGVFLPAQKRTIAHSDGDVVLHALVDALLGALALGDIGTWFPDTDPQYKNADSAIFVSPAVAAVTKAGYAIANVDVTVFAEAPKILPYREAIQSRMADLLSLTPQHLSIKATRWEGLGPIGRQEAIAAQVVVLLQKGRAHESTAE